MSATLGMPEASFGFAGPLYAQVAAILRTKISTAEWSAKAPIPNEVALAKSIGVSIGTMRKALDMLEAEHLIHRQQGRGTFVVEMSEETELERFSNLYLKSDKVRARPVTRSRLVAEANADDIAKLKAAPGSRVIRIETVWSADRGYRALERLTVPYGLCPDLDAQDLGHTQLLFALYRRQYRILVSRVEEALSCCNADAEVAKALECEPKTAVLCIDRIARNASGTAIEWSQRFVKLGEARYAVTMR